MSYLRERRVKEAVDFETAKQRALGNLYQHGPASLSELGYAIWSRADFRWPQGAAFAASGIVRKLADAGWVGSHKRGYQITAAGRAEYEKNKEKHHASDYR